MQPDPQQALRTALALGPDYCPADLLIGPVPSIVNGLKAHANTIAHARHVALEDSFPRTRALMGAEAFHAVAEMHLADPATGKLPLARIGTGFAERLSAATRDLAMVELAWLDAYGSADAPAFDLAAIAGLDAVAVASTMVCRHPACRMVDLNPPAELVWDGVTLAGDAVLVTRPRSQVLVKGSDRAVASMVRAVDRPQRLGDLLDRDQSAATILVESGAFALWEEIAL